MSAFWSLVAGAPGCRCQSAICAWNCRVPLQGSAAWCRCRAQAPKHFSGVNADVFCSYFHGISNMNNVLPHGSTVSSKSSKSVKLSLDDHIRHCWCLQLTQKIDSNHCQACIHCLRPLGVKGLCQLERFHERMGEHLQGNFGKPMTCAKCAGHKKIIVWEWPRKCFLDGVWKS